MHDLILKKLRSYRAWIRTCVSVSGVSWIAVVIVALVFLSLLVDYTQRINRPGRLFALGVGLCVVAYAVYRLLISKLAQPMNDERMAQTVEDQFPELRDRVISSLQFAWALEAGEVGRSGQSVPMMRAVAAEAAAALGPLRLGRELNFARLVRAIGSGLLCVGALIAMCFATVEGRGVMNLWFQRNILLRDIPWPQRTHLDVAYKPVVPRGDALAVSVSARGVIPDKVKIRCRWRETGRRSEEYMARVGARDSARFEVKFKNVVEELDFQVSGGDAATDWFRVRLVERPAVMQQKFWAVYPYYTRLAPRQLSTAEGLFEVLPGTVIRVAMVPSKPLESARLVVNDEEKGEPMLPVETDTPEGEGSAKERWMYRSFWLTKDATGNVADDPWATSDVWVASLRFTQDCSVAVKLTDKDGLDNRPPTRFVVRIVADKEPLVALRMKGIGDMVVPDVTLPLEISVSDDFGVKNLSLRHHFVIGEKSSVKDTGEEDVLPIEKNVLFGGKEVSCSKNWNLSNLGLVAGSVFKFHAEAADSKDVPPPNVGRTEEFSLRVVTPDELMADLIRRQVEQSQDFLRIRERQNDEVKVEIDSADASVRKNGTLTEEEKRRLAAAGDTVRHSIEEVRQVANALEQVLLEMINNKLGEPDERAKLRSEIVDPLRRLTDSLMPDLFAAVQAAGAAEGDALRSALPKVVQQNNLVLEQMDRVLGSMVKMRTFRLIVEQIRRLKGDQEKLFTDIERESERLLESILGVDGGKKPK